MDINNNVINNANDQNQQEYSADNTLTPRIPLFFQHLLVQPSLLNTATPRPSQTRFQALQKLTQPATANVGRGVLTDDVIVA
jgi:hypothetical protein